MNSDQSSPLTVEISGSVSLVLNDQGVNGDLKANDGTYSGLVEIDSAAYDVDSCLSVSALVQQNGQSRTSDIRELCVSGFGTVFESPNITEGNLIVDTGTNSDVLADELSGKALEI